MHYAEKGRNYFMQKGVDKYAHLSYYIRALTR